LKLWPAFTQPLRDGTYTTNQFSKLLVAKRSLLQSENILVPNIVADSSVMPALATSNGSYPPKANNSSLNATSQGITNQLPHTSRLLLVAAYLASYTPSRNDILLFSKAGTKAKKKKGGGTAVRNTKPGVSKHRKISRKLLGPQAFIMERVLAIYKAVVLDSNMSKLAFGGSGADLGMAVATLASLRLVVKTSPVADALDGLTKWKVNVGWDVVRVLARSVGVEVEDYVVD
jgi:origin recognition complex subunit 5